MAYLASTMDEFGKRNIAANPTGAGSEIPKEVPTPKCTEMLRLKPEAWTFKKAIWSLFTSTPSLQLQITQTPTWDQDDVFPVYNIWSPAFFGITLTQEPDMVPYKLNRRDFIVTRHEEDAVFLGAKNPQVSHFDLEDVIGTIDVDQPPFFCCRCCLQYRGWVRLASGESWRFDEIDTEYFQFVQAGTTADTASIEKRNRPTARCTILWFRNTSGVWRDGETPSDLPFEMDENTRICRICTGDVSLSRGEELDLRTCANVVGAVMNPDGFVFLDTTRQREAIDGLRDLIVLTGLAVAHLERPSLKKPY